MIWIKLSTVSVDLSTKCSIWTENRRAIGIRLDDWQVEEWPRHFCGNFGAVNELLTQQINRFETGKRQMLEDQETAAAHRMFPVAMVFMITNLAVISVLLLAVSILPPPLIDTVQMAGL
jgi:hypothetical protein